MSTNLQSGVSTQVLGKRRQRPFVDDREFVLHLSSSDAEPEAGPSMFSIPVYESPSSNPSKPYCCKFDGCTKAYKKPSRLAEHERSHTGERPFVCSTCNKSYLRETHLAAHVRVHMPESEKPFDCPEDKCQKRFWTSQHLRVHLETHTGEKPFKCTASDCYEAFFKHHQLRSHIATAHSPPGTKSYICSHDGCIKSFSTNQKLKAHAKVHEDKRYTCVHPACLGSSSVVPTFYPTWSALQHHIRTAHPPTCPRPSCNGRTFTQQKGLRAHMRLHEQREVEAELEASIVDAGSDGDDGDHDISSIAIPPRKRRRGGEVGRDWKCTEDGCDKDFKSKKALATHHNVAHLHRRDFVCPHPGCGRAFGYKHLLQRHTARLHTEGLDPDDTTPEMSPAEDDAEEAELETQRLEMSAIDFLTGRAYASRIRSSKALCCPYPSLQGLQGAFIPPPVPGVGPCPFVFSRVYDLRRHLRAEHGLEVSKDVADAWVKGWREKQHNL